MRVAGTCMAMGQAAGGAAALAGQSSRSVRDIPVAELRKLLLGQGAFLGEAVSAESGEPLALAGQAT
jgi:hypothetical protein